MCAQQADQHRYISDRFNQDDIFTFFRDNLPDCAEICLPALLCGVCFEDSRVTSVKGNTDEEGVCASDAMITFQCGHSHPHNKLLQTWEMFPDHIGLVRFTFTPNQPPEVHYWELDKEYMPPNDNGKVQAMYVKTPDVKPTACPTHGGQKFKIHRYVWQEHNEEGAYWVGGVTL